MQYRFTNEHFAVYVWLLVTLWFVLDISILGFALIRAPSESMRSLIILGVVASLSIKYPLLKMLISKSGGLDHYLYTWAGLMILLPLAGATLIVVITFIFSGGGGFTPAVVIQCIGLLLASAPGIILLIATEKCVTAR